MTATTAPTRSPATRPRPRARPDYLTSRGLIMFASILLVAGSAYKWSRIVVGPLMMHPYLPPMIATFFLSAAHRLRAFPQDILRAILAFGALYALTCVSGSFSGSLSEITKVYASIITILTIALAIRTEPDFRAAVLALNVAVILMSAGALLRGPGDGLVGINPLEEIANKNAFSMYALPAILLGGFVALDPRAAKWLRVALVGCAMVISFAVFSTANRSGWVGIFMIGVMLLLRGRRIQGVLLVGMLAGAIYLFLGRNEGRRDIFQHRYEQTIGGYHSDTMRERLFKTALQLGIEHPVGGVGPTRLRHYLAARLNTPGPEVDPHNVFGHLVGGCGLIVTGIFLFGGFLMFRRPRRMPPEPAAREAHNLLRMMMILWAVRGMFSREILYNPSFSIGIGLCIALGLVHGVWGRAPLRAQAPPGRRVAT